MAKSGNPPKKEARALRLFHTVRSTADQLVSASMPLLTQHGLTLSQFLVMEALAHKGPMNQKAIGAQIGRSGGNITMVIRNLVKGGYVRNDRFNADGRQRKISMTSEGYDLFMSVYPEFIDIYVDFFSPIPGKEQKRLTKLCSSIAPSSLADEVDEDDDPTPEI